MNTLMKSVATAVVALAGCSSFLEASGSGSSSTSSGFASGGGGTTAAAGSGDVVVPDLIGKTREEAAALVAAAGFSNELESSRPVECYDAPQIEGKINCQLPAAGETVKRYVTVQINVYQPTRIVGAVVRSQLLALLGKTPDEAKEALASYGHDGYVTVKHSKERDEACADGVVCSFDAPEGGISVHEPITLFTNRPKRPG